jgi:mRNA interferase MazF
MVRRGEVWLVPLDPTVGSELRKTRPCLVVSPDGLSHLPMVIVAPLTTGSKPARFRVPVTFQERQGLVVIDQMRAVDRRRLVKRLGEVDDVTLALTLSTLRETFED